MTPAPHTKTVDPIALAQALIRRPSVTPADAGAMAVVEDALTALGFTCRRMPFGPEAGGAAPDGAVIQNLYARLGTGSPNLCFAGHVDVVPPGPTAAWSAGPFDGEVVDGVLIGRGAVDMKGGIAAWIAAVARVLGDGPPAGSLSFLITGDEEGAALHGTKRVVQALMDEGERIDACVVGEPSSSQRLGDMIKVGRRGSLNTWFTATGRQGHVAYPDRAANPVPVLIDLMGRLAAWRLDEGHAGFPPSNLEITTIDVANPASNVIPAEARARTNIRFNPTHDGPGLMAAIDRMAAEASFGGVVVTTEHQWSGDAFLTEPGPFVQAVSDAVFATVGVRPEASTTGGTSDARFIRTLCPVLELGLVGQTMHQVDERVPVAELHALTDVYAAVIRTVLARM